jgi:hypothetical protein
LALLEGRYIVTLATENANGSAYLNAVWFLHRDGALYVGTSGTSRKARNAVARPRGALMIDVRGPALSGAAAHGPLTVIGGEQARDLNAAIARKYLTAAGLAHPDVGLRIAETDDVTIRLDPASWRIWSTAEDLGEAHDQAGISYPLDV